MFQDLIFDSVQKCFDKECLISETCALFLYFFPFLEGLVTLVSVEVFSTVCKSPNMQISCIILCVQQGFLSKDKRIS